MVKLLSGGQQYHQQITSIHTHKKMLLRTEKAVSYGQTHTKPADSLSLEGISGNMRSGIVLRTDVRDDIC